MSAILKPFKKATYFCCLSSITFAGSEECPFVCQAPKQWESIPRDGWPERKQQLQQQNILQQPRTGALEAGAPVQKQGFQQAGQSCQKAGSALRAGEVGADCPKEGHSSGGSRLAAEDSPATGWQEVEDTRRGRRRRRRSRMCSRRSRKQKNQFTNLTIYDNNLNGYNGKKASIAELLQVLQPSIVTFQDTAVTGNNVIKQKTTCVFSETGKV